MGSNRPGRGAWRRLGQLLLIAGILLATAAPGLAAPDAQQLDTQLKQTQLEVLTRERALRDRELAKAADSGGWNWGSPLVVAVFAAAVAAMGSALVALLNGRSQRMLEASKAESDRILEVVKTGDPEKAAVNLRFLMDAGLVSEPARVAQLKAYLSTRQAGGGVALPSPGRFAFAKDALASEDVQQDLAQSLNAFQAHLHAVGFKHTPDVQVNIHNDADLNAYFVPKERSIQVHPLLTSTPEIVLIEYAGAVLWGGRPPDALDSEGPGGSPEGEWDPVIELASGVFIGVREFVVASYLGDPRIGAVLARLLDSDKPYLRNLEHLHDYGPVLRDEITEPHGIGEIWGGALWEIRARVGRTKTESIVALAWEAIPTDTRYARWPAAFLESMAVQARAALPEAQASGLMDVFTRRKFFETPPAPAKPKTRRRKAA